MECTIAKGTARNQSRIGKFSRLFQTEYLSIQTHPSTNRPLERETEILFLGFLGVAAKNVSWMMFSRETLDNTSDYLRD